MGTSTFMAAARTSNLVLALLTESVTSISFMMNWP